MPGKSKSKMDYRGGGKVKMTAGAGSGVGRKQKAKGYKSGGKAMEKRGYGAARKG